MTGNIFKHVNKAGQRLSAAKYRTIFAPAINYCAAVLCPQKNQRVISINTGETSLKYHFKTVFLGSTC